MKYCYLLIRIVLLLTAMGIWQSQAYGGCASNKLPTMEFSSNFIRKIDYNLQNNQPITEWETASYPIYSNCAFSKSWIVGYRVAFGQSTNKKYGPYTIFRVNGRDSIGYILEAKAWSPEGKPVWKPISVSSTGGDTLVPLAQNLSEKIRSIQGAVRIRLIKIGTIQQSSAPFSVTPALDSTGFYAKVYDGGNPENLNSVTFSGKFIADGTSCTTSFPSNVVLGSYPTSALRTPGAETTPVPFAISLSNCSTLGTTYAYFSVDGSADPNSGTPHLLQLDDPNNPGTAQGVGIKLRFRYPGDPTNRNVILNGLQQLLPRTRAITPGASFTIPFSASYIRDNASTLKPGRANATVTFTIIYGNN